MTIFKVKIGQDGVYYDRRDCLDERDCEVKFIVAESYDNANEIVLKYMHDNYDDAEYELEEWDPGYEGILLDDYLEIDGDYTR